MCPDEKPGWHPDVDVLSQRNAWVDTTVSVNRVNTTLKPVDDFKEVVSNLKGVV